MGFLSSIAKTAGNLLYSATGAKQASAEQFKYQSELQKQANDMNVYNAQHAHQWEIEDLQKAGLNPVLSAGGSGANVSSATAGGATAGNAQGDILGAITNAVSLKNQMEQTDSNIELQKSQAQLADTQSAKNVEENKWITPTAKSQIRQINSATAVNNAETKLKSAQKANTQMDSELKNAQRWRTYHENQLNDKQRDKLAKEIKYYEANMISNAASKLLK